jgi:glycerophosphoryl diester phosphodiesterase
MKSPNERPSQGSKGQRPKVIAHRGASGERPENTLPAYALAVEQGADMIEIDLHLSRDGVVMIHHDASLERLGGEGEIGDHTAGDLALLDAAPESSESLPMPTLLEVLDGFGERIEFNLEIKIGGDAPYAGIEEISLAAVEERGLMERMLFSSFYDEVLARLRAESDSARLALLISPKAPVAILERAAAVGAEAIHPEVSLVDRQLVDSAHAAGLKVYPYTENSLEGMERLLDCGVDGIITNHPADLHALLDSRGASG